MGKYNGAVITTAGQNVISQAISGTELTWLTMKTSSTAIPAGTNVETLTTLSGIEQTSNITDATVYGNNVLQLSARFSNTNISTAYYIQTVGIYGQLAGGSETLIAVMTAVTPDEMPVYDPDAPSAFIFNVQITVQNAESVVMTVNDTGTATVADLNRKVDIQSGNISNTVVTTITASSASYPSIAAGDTVAVAAGKVNKSLSDLGSNKLDKTGDAADAKIGSSTASTAAYPIPAANDTFKVILGKIIKFFTDIKAAYTNVSVSGKTVTFTTAAGGTKQITTQDTTYSVVSKTASGLAPQLPNETTTTKYLRQDGAWQVPPNTTYSNFTKATASAAGTHGLVPAPAAGKQGQFLRGDATWATPTNTTYSAGSGLSLSVTTFNHSNSVTAGTAGQSSASSGRSTLAVPYVTYDAQGHVTAAGTHTHTINNVSGASSTANGGAGLVPAPTSANYNNRALMYLRSDGGWQYLPLQNNATTTAEHYALDARMGKTLQTAINGKNPTVSNTNNKNTTVNVASETDVTVGYYDVTAGTYIFMAFVDVAQNNNGRRYIALASSTNSGSTWTENAHFNINPNTGFMTSVSLADYFTFTANARVAVRVWQNSGSTLAVDSSITYIKLK